MVLECSEASECLLHEALAWAWLYAMFGLSNLLGKEGIVLLDPYFFVLAIETYEIPEEEFLDKSVVDSKSMALHRAKALIHLLPEARTMVRSGIPYICPHGFPFINALDKAKSIGSDYVDPIHFLLALLESRVGYLLPVGDDMLRKILEYDARGS